MVPDESLSIDEGAVAPWQTLMWSLEGAVAPWQTLMWSLMKDIAREMGVRTDVPFRELTPQEREIRTVAAPGSVWRPVLRCCGASHWTKPAR